MESGAKGEVTVYVTVVQMGGTDASSLSAKVVVSREILNETCRKNVLSYILC